MKEKLIAFYKMAVKFVTENKSLTALIALVLVAAIIAVSIAVAGPTGAQVNGPTPSEPVSSETPSDENPSSDSQTSSDTTSSTPVVKPVLTDNYYDLYNSKMDMDNNFFMDSLEYTGYNLKKHRADGEMWNYILAATKRGRGWLSQIGYDYDGSSTGYETNSEGKPDIEYFNSNGLVCASYISYVYYNYLGNVVGIDVSKIEKPENPKLAHDWYLVAQKWVEDGYSEEISYTAKLVGGRISFKADKEIPIGSLIVFQALDNQNGWARHVALYAGYKNGNHWVYHVGNDNGPEFCSIERMSCGPGGQFMLGVYSTPTYITEGILSKMGN